MLSLLDELKRRIELKQQHIILIKEDLRGLKEKLKAEIKRQEGKKS